MSSSKYAHGHSAETVKGHAHRTADTFARFLLPHLSPGQKVLDVGCGPGSITLGLAEYGGEVIGLDQAEEVIAGAQAGIGKTAREKGLKLEFQVGDLLALPFPDGHFDVVFAHQVMLHIPAPQLDPAFTELRRVLKPGGLLAIRDGKPEYGGSATYPYNPLFSKTIDIIVSRVHASGAEAEAAGGFVQRARKAGFHRVERNFTQDVYDTPETRKIWGEQWAKRSQEEAFKRFALERGLASEEELLGMQQAWTAWCENPDAWATFFEIEHLCWK